MINILSLSSQIGELDKKLNAIADQFFDNPFSGMVVFIILLVIGWIAVKSYASK